MSSPSDPTKVVYEKGDRVRMSAKGKEHLKTKPQNNHRIGTVPTRQRENTIFVTVLWDGIKYSNRYHKSFIEKVEDGRENATP